VIDMTRGKLVIGIVGMPGAGKAVVRRIAKTMGCSEVVMGDVVRQEVRRRGLPPSPENLGKVMLTLREEKGPTVVADQCIPRIRSSETDIVVVDGLRSLHEANAFRAHFPDFTLVAIHSSPEIRFQRLFRRQRNDDPKRWDTFAARDSRELHVGLGSAIATADWMIVNEGTRAEFKRKARQILEAVIARWMK
jgi:dephospho-CoA kinase